MDSSKRSEAERGESSHTAIDGHTAKKVRLRDRAENPPPMRQQKSYSDVVTGQHPDPENEELAWPEEVLPEVEEVLPEVEEGDITFVSGSCGHAIELSEPFKNLLDKLWEKAVMVKLLGRRIGYRLLKNRLISMWNLSGSLKVIDLENDFFLVNLLNTDYYLTALTKGPWVIFGHALAVQPWTPTFRPSQGKVEKAVVWVCFPDLPVSRYHPGILQAMGSLLGRTVKIDTNTQQSQRGRFARVAVEIDLTAPVIPIVELEGETIKVTYEGLPQICFECGRVGHGVEICPHRTHKTHDPTENSCDAQHRTTADSRNTQGAGEAQSPVRPPQHPMHAKSIPSRHERNHVAINISSHTDLVYQDPSYKLPEDDVMECEATAMLVSSPMHMEKDIPDGIVNDDRPTSV
ncbi:hypothetical protein K2173_016666 [Erythroxylum novogranatense]|uniref:CCHC-type domain-containing protein n=1 Tax=Erythroxylum novogranatense TaxID=1862640 RepID=A0AAV8SS03_9ROSI|nr:hypothetical protein K2173_016666 [Erythroxylum novogranatense]